MISSISIQSLIILASMSQLIQCGDLGFYGEIHGHTKEDKKSEVLHNTPYQYRQKKPSSSPLNLDPYSIDFDFLHKGKASPEKTVNHTSPSSYRSSPIYTPPSKRQGISQPYVSGSPYGAQASSYNKPPTTSSYASFTPYKPPSHSSSFLKPNEKQQGFGEHFEEPKDFDHFGGDYEDDYSLPPSAPNHHQASGPSGFNDDNFKEYSTDPFAHHHVGSDYDDSGSQSSPGSQVKNFANFHTHRPPYLPSSSQGKAKEVPQDEGPSYLRVEYGYKTGGSNVKYSYHHGYEDNEH